MENLNDFSKIPDENLNESFNPAADIFNSAGNTKFSNDEENNNGSDNKDNNSGGNNFANNNGFSGNTGSNTSDIKGKVVLGKLISGKQAVTIINIFIPSFIVFALRQFKYDANKQQFKLNNEEKEVLNPVVQDCLNYMSVNFDNPFYALAFVASMIYGSKIMDVIPEVKKITEDSVNDIVSNISKEEVTQQPVVNNTPQNREYISIRERIDSTSIRSEKNKIIVETIEQRQPTDLIEMWKIYNGIFPERKENYFRKWYAGNIELFPESLRYGVESSSDDNDDTKDFSLE